MPAAQVKPNDRDEAFERIVDLGHGQQRLRVRHEATTAPRRISTLSVAEDGGMEVCTHFVIRSSIDLGSRMKVGSTTLLRSAPGRSWEMMWERTVIAQESACTMSYCTEHFSTAQY